MPKPNRGPKPEDPGKKSSRLMGTSSTTPGPKAKSQKLPKKQCTLSTTHGGHPYTGVKGRRGSEVRTKYWCPGNKA